MRSTLFLLGIAPLLLTGCFGQKKLITRQAQMLDSLYVAERTMRAELYALQDSIRFYDDIDSGLYFRNQRVLNDRINRLEYLLAAQRDEYCAPVPIDTLLVDDLFEPASALLTERGTEALATLAEEIESRYAGRRLRVEGHSDNVPLGSKLQEHYPTNWELSAARAAAVVRHLVAEHNLDPTRFEVVAFGDVRPVAPNTTNRGRRLNRRIGILVLPE
ncbi:MAG: flagellar motor protein MotB [Rhodothermales bacterium]